MTTFCRMLAQKQLSWHRKDNRFKWINMAPGIEGQPLAIEEVGERIAQWLENDVPLPDEWDGTSLMALVWTVLLLTAVN